MTRLARMMVGGLPHHVTQRGNRREAVFFEDGDHDIYRDLLASRLVTTLLSPDLLSPKSRTG
jgi:putative transposase